MRVSTKLFGLPLVLLSAIAFAGWEYAENSDPFSDEDRSAITATPDMYERQDVLLAVGLKCMEDGLNFVLLHKFLGGDIDDEVRVQLRVDKSPPYGPAYWKLFPDKQASWMPMKDVTAMAAQMRAGNSLHIRVIDPLDGETLTQAVNLKGFSSALSRLPCYR